MSKKLAPKLETYLEEATSNIRNDRALASKLLVDIMNDMSPSSHDRRELGITAAKYLETLQRSNEQMVKLAALLQRQKQQQVGLTADDKEQLFDMLNENKEDDE